MGFLQGAPLPDVTVTTGKTQAAPDYYTDYLADLSKVGTDALKTTAEKGVAAYDPMQTLGYSKVEDAAKAYVPGITAAETTAGNLTAGLDLNRISQFMNPYQTNVVDEMERLAQQNIQRNVLPSLKGAFVGSGGLGGQRYAGALGQSMADIQANLTGQQTGALQKGYSESLLAALQEAGLMRQATDLQADLAGKAQQYGLTEAGALTKAGAEQQAYEQAQLDFPTKRAADIAALMRGYNIPISETETRKGPLAGSYGTSGMQDLTTLTSLLGSASLGTAGSNIGGALGGLGKFLQGLGGTGGTAINDYVNSLLSGYDPASSDYYPGGDDGGAI